MTPLQRKIAARIGAEGPILLDTFWDMALFDPEDGYYIAREPFGRAGDFVTAPEISQMFGEMIGAWLVAAWTDLGAPPSFQLCEIGPGRGTLMADIVRTVRQIAPAFLKAARFRLVETSDRLAARQLQALERFDLPVRRLRRISELDEAPTIVFANELFDALSIRQFVFEDGRWRERRVGIDANGRPGFVVGEANEPAARAIAALGLAAPAPGALFEASPAREKLAAEIAARLRRDGGAGLFIDYGHAAPAFGDTVQAVRDHRYAGPFKSVGMCDLTSHVDFSRIAAPFEAAGLALAPVTAQGDFLLALGLAERAGALGSRADEAKRAEIVEAVQRLAGSGPDHMGTLFKVLAVASRPLSVPPFDTPQAAPANIET